MTVRFYDVGQALAVLVELPDGRRILVDTGEQPRRAGCGAACERWSAHLLENLERHLPDQRLDLLWITHQHSDHIGNADSILRRFRVDRYVDNGTNLDAGPVLRAREAARDTRTEITVVDPGHPNSPLPDTNEVTLTPLVPSAWPAKCDREPNDCSIGLRIDYCESSVLFLGDAEYREEAALSLSRPADLLQVAHHGSDTSSSEAFLSNVQPSWAVISVAKPGEASNRGYCHPRRVTVERLSALLGGSERRPLQVFQGASCRQARPDDWLSIQVSPRLLATARDGDVVLNTRGGGEFSLVPSSDPESAAGEPPG